MTYRSLIISVMLAIIYILPVSPAAAQDPTPTPDIAPKEATQVPENTTVWNKAVNLSRSGAASQPMIVKGAEGQFTAFWWDYFDGLKRSKFDGEAWMEPDSVPLPSAQLDRPPHILRDGLDRHYAFWIEENDGVRDLIYSTLYPNAVGWSYPRKLASSIAAFSIENDAEGGLALTYILTKNTAAQPSGVYFLTLKSGYSYWSQPVEVYSSVYLRSVDQERAFLSLLQDDEGVWRITWREPQTGQLFVAHSYDAGKKWNEPLAVGEEFETLAKPQMTILPNGRVVLMWQLGSGIACTYYQQEWAAQPDEPQQDDAEPAEATPEPRQESLNAPVRIWQEMMNCSSTNHFWKVDDRLFWISGEKTNRLTLAVYSEDEKWSAPFNLQVSFVDEETQSQVDLDELTTTMYKDQLVVIGTDKNRGEVWTTMTQVGAFELVYSPRSPWTPGHLFSEGSQIAPPVAAVDSEGYYYVVWSQENNDGQRGSVLFSAFGQEGTMSQAFPFPVSSAEQVLARQPDILVDPADNLHLVWVEGIEGNLQYRKANPTDVRSAGDWSAPKSLYTSKLASWPQISRDAAGNIYILFVIPLNEDRGIYLLHSPDDGINWDEPQMVVNAAASDWEIVNRPTLAVSPDGILHAAWVRADVPDSIHSQSIVYTYSVDNGDSWSDPLEITGAGYDYPKIGLVNGQINLLYSDGRGDVWHRWSPLHPDTQLADNWSAAARVPGFQGTAAHFGVTTSGSISAGSLHIVAATAAGSSRGVSSLVYSSWNGQQWGTTAEQSIEVSAVKGVSAFGAAHPQGGTLAVVWLVQNVNSSQQEIKNLYIVTRSIPIFDVENLPAGKPVARITPTNTPEHILTSTPTPTAIPAVNRNMNSLNEDPPPLLLSSVLVFITLAAVFGTQWFIRKKH